jgi:DNA-binding winged helix-turn-helix (wHTH) protein/tetratricopeptide (TPR) repeat protein
MSIMHTARPAEEAMRYTFADCELDTQLYTLRRSGHLLQLRPKVFQVLLYLVEHRHRVVPKQELLAHVWPGLFISDATLENCLKEVRQALGDSGRAQRLIHTLRGHGYRLIAAVETRAEASLEETPAIPAVPIPLPAPVAAQSRLTPGVVAGERKAVTMLCCGLGETPVLRGDDGLDTLHSLLQTLHTIVQEEVGHYGGVVQQVTSAHLLAVFGAPVAYEDHATRAVLAALGIQRRVRGTSLATGALTVHMGLHTGLVAVGGLGDESGATLPLIGDVSRLATLLQARAAPGVPLCSAATARLVRHTMRLKAAQPVSEGGQTSPVTTYRILGQRPPRLPVVVRDDRALSRFVGRTRELALLQALLAQVATGRGQVVGLVGDPGMGKSRLLYEFRQHLRGKPVTYVAGQCLSYGQATPYLPVMDILRSLCGLTETDSGATLVAKVQSAMQAAGLAVTEWAPYLFYLLGVQADTTALTLQPPEILKPRTFAALRQVMLRRSQQQPLVMAIDNLHWIDPTSEEYLTSLVEHLAGAPLLLLVTYRPGYRPPWMDKSYATQLALQPLDTQDSRTVLQGILRSLPVPDALINTLLRTAEGNPFFLEELAWTVVEQGAAALTLAVPATVQAVLAARIDRLPPEAKMLLQAAAVIGHTVPFPLLQAITERPEADLHRSLTHVQATEFLYEAQGVPERAYTFKHALTQEVAYGSLLQERRRALHERTAQALEALYADRLEEHYGALAHHYCQSGNTAKAVTYLQCAGEQAMQRSAYAEAVQHLATGAEILRTLPDIPKRARQELNLVITLGEAVRMTQSETSPDYERAYFRAHALCQQLGDTPQLFEVLIGLRQYYEVRGQCQRAYELAEQIFVLAQRLEDPARLAEAHYALGLTLYYLGDLPVARAHFEQRIALYEPRQRGSMVHSLSYVAYLLWVLGYPDQALRRTHEALTVAQAWSYPFSMYLALYHAGHVHRLRREVHAAQERNEAAVARAAELGLARRLPMTVHQRGWVLAAQGRHAEGLAQMREGLRALQATGAELAQPRLLALLAEAYGYRGHAEDGLRVVAEALAVAQRTGERRDAAEISRVKGELLLQYAVTNAPEAEACFQQALALARRQQAKSWELRAAMSLARLWQRQGKRAEARELLAEIYGWFTEGFDTADLRDAKALLEALA